MVCNPSTSRGVTESLDRYYTTLRSLLDVHAPVKTVCVRAAGTAPWYDEVLRSFTSASRQKFSSSSSGSYFSIYSEVTGLQLSIRAAGGSKLFGRTRNCERDVAGTAPDFNPLISDDSKAVVDVFG